MCFSNAYTCFCSEELVQRYGKYTLSIVPQAIIKKMEQEIPQYNSIFYFYSTFTFKTNHGPSDCAVLCPSCGGLSIYKDIEDAVLVFYYLPEKRYEHFPLEPPELLREFTCTCGKAVDTSGLTNQWTIIPEYIPERERIALVFRKHGTVAEYYERLYDVGKRMIACPHCLGVTTIQCDQQGNGISAEYFTKRQETTSTASDRNYLYHEFLEECPVVENEESAD